MTAGPCLACPWRTANQGKPHPEGWYTKTNRARLWAGLRRGESMSCHPTDPANPVSDRAEQAGYRPAPEESKVRECTGGLILQQREMTIINDSGGDLAAYRKDRPRGLTKDGIRRMLNRIVFGGVLGEPPMAKPNLNEPVAHDPLPWRNRAAHPEAGAAEQPGEAGS